jgi:hypothetical protein
MCSLGMLFSQGEERMEKNNRKKVILFYLIVFVSVILIGFLGYSLYAGYQNRKAQQWDAEWERRKSEHNAYMEAHPTATPKPTADPKTYEIPVVGMAEENINETKYQRRFQMTFEYFNGKTTERYYSDGKGTRSNPKYIIVVCKNGIVTSVIDHRKNPWTDQKEGSSSGQKSGKNSGSDKQDDYYGDAEEFYYDHIEEFDDFDDAEEYYNERYGK